VPLSQCRPVISPQRADVLHPDGRRNGSNVLSRPMREKASQPRFSRVKTHQKCPLFWGVILSELSTFPQLGGHDGCNHNSCGNVANSGCALVPGRARERREGLFRHLEHALLRRRERPIRVNEGEPLEVRRPRQTNRRVAALGGESQYPPRHPARIGEGQIHHHRAQRRRGPENSPGGHAGQKEVLKRLSGLRYSIPVTWLFTRPFRWFRLARWPGLL